MVRFRDLATALARREIQVRYKQTLLGVGWAVLQPLLAAGAFSVIFGRLSDFETEGVPYAVFALAGLAAWMFFAAAVNRCSSILVENEEMITKVYFPRLLVCVAAVLAALPDLAVALMVLLLAVVVTGTPIGLQVLALPLVLVLLAVLTLGTGALFCALNIRYRDVRHGLPFALQLGLLLSPVAYPSSIVTGSAETALYLNPVAGLLDVARWCLIDTPPPPSAALLSLVTGVLLVVLGLWTFGRMERRFADLI
jgi:lipopolysaccharide transport system permease protein